ncbi:chaperonin GroES [Caldicellulosiruptor bescii]|jgi:chaperonin GroES|uniref:Co-chaperonin GroES n=12 Tax=Caldicellulosiruptoraceae TaxID=3071002 RepID=CH10_CALBD|nr:MULTISPECIES: co-chaperone GroES [Caldicellulosiruptor]A4XJ08.1 RecName: Full=Co-chaperonin GroES; AltName: Full=10 kDa chaperonin; AltName: Full=Chaperonin-10; Short=Cpn10 [Caldicellulosiruptor saccharolyticus DSM 8903]B9MLZ0.1 RecName: Full=Co-chaperonin GroES; AltName: Full=10 kDa chaperonin; AltName: Full=Chaperonin-10; Short=Cpn10 [Caldicellulosiruptor bescii DSM 6725]ABP66893.1 chaperonin Cpn10 [Caldicellulosiruptor saccharolyticus DSM 8903]ACM61213.1 chaperonin Cpn10 [Caldicellulosiru
MKIRPIGDRILIKFKEREEVTKSGIVLPDTVKEKPQIAEVIEVGPGGIVDGEKVEMVVKKGDKVIVSKYAGTEIKIDGEEYTIIRQDDVLAIIED